MVLGVLAYMLMRLREAAHEEPVIREGELIRTPRPVSTPRGRTLGDCQLDCDYNCDQYLSDTWDRWAGYGTLEYFECLDREDWCHDAVVDCIDRFSDSLRREMEREGKGSPDEDWGYPENWY